VHLKRYHKIIDTQLTDRIRSADDTRCHMHVGLHPVVSNALDVAFGCVFLLVWTRKVRRDGRATRTADGGLVTYDVVLL
jgi:hypothetical protein